MKYFFLFSIAAALFTSCGTEQEGQVTDIPPAEPEMSAGKKLFINNCIQCHSVTQDKVGPKLEGVLERWNNDTTRITAFIHNSQKVIESGDARAVEVYEKWNHSVMTPMPHLSDGDIKKILQYIGEGKD